MKSTEQDASVFRRVLNVLRHIRKRPAKVDMSARRRQFVIDDPDCFVSVPYAKFHSKTRTKSVITPRK